MILAAAIVLALLNAGAMVYCVLTIVAARNYSAVRRPPSGSLGPVSILKPLFGADEGLEENLRSFFAQDYPDFELLMSVNRHDDSATAVAEKVMREFPSVPAKLIVTGMSPRPNGKVFSLDRLMQDARHDILVMADSDIRVTPQMLHVLASELQDRRVGLVTCPYRAIPGASFWSRLEALGMNTEFLGGVLVARLLTGMDFALGCTLAVRRGALNAIGGFGVLKDYLAEDFMMGRLVAQSGSQVILSSYRIEHRIGSQRFRANFDHRLRWARSTRRSRPAGYVGEIFTNPLPLAIALWAVYPAWWPLAASAAVLRAASAWLVARATLQDPLIAGHWWLLPVQDVASFVCWVLGFFGNTVKWRGRELEVGRDGKFKETRP